MCWVATYWHCVRWDMDEAWILDRKVAAKVAEWIQEQKVAAMEAVFDGPASMPPFLVFLLISPNEWTCFAVELGRLSDIRQ